jgi:MFS family permease
MPGVQRQLRDAAVAFAAVFRNPNLRRLQTAAAGVAIGDWAYAVAVSVFAYHHDGAKAVGLLWLIRMVPGAAISPFAAVLADRFPRERVMLSSDLLRAAVIGGAAASAYAGGPPKVVYALAVTTTLIGTPFKPAEGALVAVLAKTPSELTAANVVGNTIDSVGFFVGPAVAGVLLSVVSTPTVFVVTACLVLWSAFFISRLDIVAEPLPERPPGVASVLADVKEGFAVLGDDARLRFVVILIGARTLVAGAFEVLVVVTAISLLDIGDGGVGYLNSVFGVGAIVGTLAAGGMLVGLRRLSVPFIAGSILWGVPFVLIGAWVQPWFAYLMFALLGLGAMVGEVAGFTLAQRAVPNELLGRVFGVMQMVLLACVGIGAAVIPFVIDWLGVRGALVATGLLIPVIVLLVGPKLVRIDAEATAPEARRLALLRGINIFAPLPGLILEQLASQLIELHEEAGTDVVRQGDPGDRFYIIASGTVDVMADGKHVATDGPGDYFGEIALLKDVPRTATCTAATPVDLYALERENFLEAVTGHPQSTQVAEGVIGARLAGLTAVTGGGLSTRPGRL